MVLLFLGFFIKHGDNVDGSWYGIFALSVYLAALVRPLTARNNDLAAFFALFELRRDQDIAPQQKFVICAAERDCSAKFSARIALHPSRLKDEPLRGFVSVQIFERVKTLYGCCFSSGYEGLFCGTIFPKKPTFSLIEKDVR